ncbi:antirestriction protein ArdA [Brucella pseudogrignonensis]|uniref:antirestriction protein ArdA n=1 Tax=Brucella pseudogrignonensis TaxID=419475 RepID=UPI000CFDAB4E|nr:antirestriction protein ArdA [Brucella pseudogrignonensis]MQP38762.1 antirestriction protein ArdA [Ochrobactrum sp. MYb237]PQZ43381.1 antirestriction protein [Brucella pseudogrignonensis]PRA43128.1 antirestriction protein [Brucella pseudogrignonensis]PRA72402.1 antirestriction protein [Brucella pseudogrignonensis]
MPRIYAACLASYNNGVLHGRWIEASSDVDEMQDEINAMLRESKFPNVMVPNWEGTADANGFTRCGDGTVLDLQNRLFDTAKEAVEANVVDMKMAPSAEEWAMHDSEDLPSCFGEYPGLQAIADYVEFLEDHHEHDEDDLRAIFEDYRSADDASDAMANRFVTICESFRNYADEYADEVVLAECSNETARQYFDYESFARDLKHDYNVIDVPSGVAIFHH